MINPEDLDYMVEETLVKLNAKNLSTRMLIKLTFLLESNLEDVVDAERNYFGFSQITKRQMAYLIENTVIPREQLMDSINKTCLVDVRNDGYNALSFNLMTNISFQIAMTYAHYRGKWSKPPNDNIDDIIDYYFRLWDNKTNVPKKKIEKIKELYEETFSNL